MGLDSLNNNNRAYDLAQARRAEEATQGDALLAQVRQGSSQAAKQTANRVNDAFQRGQAAATQFAQLEKGRQTADAAAQAADPNHPEQADAPQTQQTQPENQATTAHEAPAAEQPTPTEQAAAPEPQAAEATQHDDNLPLPAGERPAASGHAPVVANAPREASPPQHADNHAQPQQGQGDPHAGNPQAQRTAQRPTVRRGEQPANPEEGVLTPREQLARLSRGGVPATRTPATATPTPQVAPNTPAALLAQGTTTPVPPAPETPAQQAPANSLFTYHAGDVHQPEEYAHHIEQGLRYMCLTGAPSENPQRVAQHAFTAAVVTQQTAQPMTFAGLREARERERRSREGVAGIAPREGRGSQREGELAGLVGRGMYHSVRG